MNNIKAILFDLDNTILDRTSTFNNFINSFLKTYFDHFEMKQEIFDRIIYLDQDGYKDKQELFSELLEELPWELKPLKTELLDFYSTEYVKNAVLMEHAREIVQHLRKKYKTGLITNGKTVIQYGKIDQLEIRNDFDLIIVSEEAGIKKPDPKIFELALRKLELSPEQCIFIGDHPVNDIEGAAKIGMKTIWMKVNQPWKDGLTAKPLHSIERLNELYELI
ncbi:HAD family hydrolase [Paenibacillus sp. GP183]|jgi:putative hydrolase of the HAD superfamily|uniref:HAD family hydrolase n=1 Tax=Paenibacillus sp. GP183 TaxID=1882751 RepID=UPI000897746D|nr:HAD family hydrolase [Paenibacillus sp. GP183]SEB56166.1 putative hydrolase of the HAD superfamily [Paenibacillus sp. GP183]